MLSYDKVGFERIVVGEPLPGPAREAQLRNQTLMLLEWGNNGNYTRLEWLFDTKVRETVAKTGELTATAQRTTAARTS